MNVNMSSLLEYEAGELEDEDTLELFACLVRTGMAWTLQGHYGRTAKDFIDGGWLDTDGNILRELEG